MPSLLNSSPSRSDAALPTVGDRVRFVVASPVPGAPPMQGDGYVVAQLETVPGHVVYLVAVLNYPGVLTLAAPYCQVIEGGALTRRVSVT